MRIVIKLRKLRLTLKNSKIKNKNINKLMNKKIRKEMKLKNKKNSNKKKIPLKKLNNKFYPDKKNRLENIEEKNKRKINF